MFCVLAMKSDVSSILLQTNSDLVFRFWMPFLDSHSSENTFLYVGNKIALLWVLYHKKSVFAFSLLKHVGLNFIAQKTFWFVCCNIGFLLLLLHQKKVFFQYAASHPDFDLILLQQRFCFLFAELRSLRIVFLGRTLFSVSVIKLHLGGFILPEKCFGLLAT